MRLLCVCVCLCAVAPRLCEVMVEFVPSTGPALAKPLTATLASDRMQSAYTHTHTHTHTHRCAPTYLTY